jgi:hypothetical protein
MRASKWFLAMLLAAVACGGPRLDTRTFQLSHIDAEQAVELLKPYVFSDRTKAPGLISYSRAGGGSITVRETPDNLDKIARVLAQLDRPEPSVRLTFQIIQADGAASTDPAIAGVEGALRKLFRFKGYRLLAEAVAGGMGGSEVRQTVSGPGGPYVINATIFDVRGSGDSGSVRIRAELFVERAGLVLNTAVTLSPGQTAVLGNAQLSSKTGTGTLILTVRPELVP